MKSGWMALGILSLVACLLPGGLTQIIPATTLGEMGLGTGAIKVDGNYWISTAHSDRIAISDTEGRLRTRGSYQGTSPVWLK